MELLSRHWKAVIATVAAIAITVVQAVQSGQSDGQWTGEDTTVTVLAFLGAVLVYSKQNTSTDPVVASRESVVYTGKHARGDAGEISQGLLLVLAVVGVVAIVLFVVSRV